MAYRDKLGREIKVGDLLLTGCGSNGRRLSIEYCLDSRIGVLYTTGLSYINRALYINGVPQLDNNGKNIYEKSWYVSGWDNEKDCFRPRYKGTRATTREFIIIERESLVNFGDHDKLLEILAKLDKETQDDKSGIAES